jgi:hypothetical protein
MLMSWWKDIADTLPKPWPREAVYYDLRWWADHERRESGKRPGRPTLRARWGWSDRQVRNALKAEATWGDPRWADRTATGQRADSYRTAFQPVGKVSPESADSQRTATGQPTSPRAELHSTQITDHKNNNTPPTPHGGSPSPAPKSKPRKRTAKKASGLTVEAIHAIPIPEALIALEGFTEKWQAWTRLRQDSSQPRKRWREAQQIAAILSKLSAWHTGGLDVLAGLESAYTSSWQGISKSYLEPVALRRSSKPVVSMLNNPPDMSRLIPRKARPAPDLLANRYTRKVT